MSENTKHNTAYSPSLAAIFVIIDVPYFLCESVIENGILISKYSEQFTFQWRHNGRDGVPNHQPHDRLLNRLFRHRWKKTSKLRVTGLCEGNSPVIAEFPTQTASNWENVSIWWRHHVPVPLLCSDQYSVIYSHQISRVYDTHSTLHYVLFYRGICCVHAKMWWCDRFSNNIKPFVAHDWLRTTTGMPQWKLGIKTNIPYFDYVNNLQIPLKLY